jgi:N-acetylglutamate synthase-like GNAT family acetyltransferase
MKIVPFENQYLEEMAQFFVQEYSEIDRKWDLVTTRKYLKRNSDNFPQYCFVAIDDQNNCLGAIFGRLDPYYTSNMLLIDSLQVKKEYRQQGIARKLIKTIFNVAKKDNIVGVHLLADAREGFPKNWYTKMGFELTGWTEYEVEISNIKI